MCDLTVHLLEALTMCHPKGVMSLSQNILNDMSGIVWALGICNSRKFFERMWEIVDVCGQLY